MIRVYENILQTSNIERIEHEWHILPLCCKLLQHGMADFVMYKYFCRGIARHLFKKHVFLTFLWGGRRKINT